MLGLTPQANEIIDSFSEIELLKEYQLVGGTSLALQIHHRLSEDLDFCQWVPDNSKAQFGVNARHIHKELTSRYKVVECNHLGFEQATIILNIQA